MTATARIALLLCLCQIWPVAARARHDELVRLATLDWPPYTSAALPDGGLTVALVREALSQAGYRLEVVPMPWPRAVASGLNAAQFDGYFPEYLSPEVRRRCFLSPSAGESPLVLAKRKNTQIEIHGLNDLTHYRVGVVNGYNNTDAFDANVSSGLQKVDRADSDQANLQKLISGRVDLILIDRNVMQWQLTRSQKLQSHASDLEVLEPPLQLHGLYLCFKRSAHGQKLADAFSRGIRHVNVANFSHSYMEALPTH
jgi:polar amino acid transport system substrate-binding protein